MMDDKILDLRDLPKEVQALEVTALMLFPGDEEKRIHWILRRCLAYTAKIYSDKYNLNQSVEEEISLNAQLGYDLGSLITRYGGWAALADATVGDYNYGALIKQSNERINIGIQTGATIFEAIRTECGIGQSGTGKKSGHEPGAAQTIEKAVKKAGSEFLYSTESYTRKTSDWYSWKNYKSVAHLWGAYVRSFIPKKKGLENISVLSLENFQGPSLNLSDADKSSTPPFREGLPGFLEYAQWFLESACLTKPRAGKRKPILTEEEAWKIVL